MKLFPRKSIKLATGFGLFFSLYTIASNEKVHANACASNPNNLTSDCYITPSTYKIRVYEMGLCTSDPLAGINTTTGNTSNNSIDESSCTKTFQSANGSLVDLSGSTSQTLTGTNFRPPSGTYPHAYIKIKNTFGLKGSYTINSQTYYSKNDGTPGALGTYSEFDENLLDFNGGPTCSSSPELGAYETFTTGSTGTMKASLAQVSGGNLGTYTADSSCGSSTHLFGAFSPTSPVVITDNTQGLEVSFTITDSGMTVIPNGSGGIQTFAGGPFRPSFTVF